MVSSGMLLSGVAALLAIFAGGLLSGTFDSTIISLAPQVIRLALQQRQRGQDVFAGYVNDDDSLHVVLCGTSSPLPEPSRAGPCTIVMGGGELFMIDAGPASVRKINQMGITFGALSGIFMTHYHSDHIADFGEAVVNSWMQGRREPVTTYGPPGVKNLVEGYRLAYSMDQTYRTSHHTEEYMPPSGALSEAQEFPLPPSGGSHILTSKKGIKVTAFEMDHWPVHPAVGYKFEFNGRTIVVTGDGEPTPELLRQQEGVDLVVRNTINKKFMLALSGAMNETKMRPFTRLGKMLWDTLDYHSDPMDAMEDAAKHQVQLLVICHLAPPATNIIQRLITDAIFRRQPEDWRGMMVFGSDGDHWSLPKGSTAINRLA